MNVPIKFLIFSILILVFAKTYFGNFDSILVYISQWPLGQAITVYGHTISSYIYTSSPPEGIVKKKVSKSKKIRIFKPEILKSYDGSEGSKGLYLGILGRIYNVKKGKNHYGPNGGYSFFAGKDGSRAFVSGDFTEKGLTDDVTGLSKQDYIGLNGWVKFYEKDYKFVGKLSGRFYDNGGNPTEYNLKVQKWIEDALFKKEDDDKEREMFPLCNSEWGKDTGSRLWCTKKSGGVERSWVGVPRKLYSPGKQSARCACIKDIGPPSHDLLSTSHHNNGDLDYPKLEKYSGCDPTSSSCQVKLS